MKSIFVGIGFVILTGFCCQPFAGFEIIQESNEPSPSASSSKNGSIPEEPENETAKTASETWRAYVKRLVVKRYLSEAEMREWLAGKEISKTRKFDQTLFRNVQRTRMVTVQKSRTEIVEGEKKIVPFQEKRAQSYFVPIPYTQRMEATFNLPSPGSLNETAEHPGYVRSDGKQIHTKPPKPPSSEQLPLPMTPEKETCKSAGETWQAFMARMVKRKYITEKELEHWNAGNPLTIRRTVSKTVMRLETRIRNVPVEEGEAKDPDVKFKEQRYQVEMPVQQSVMMTLDVPPPGSLADNIARPGFMVPAKTDPANLKK